MSAGPKKEEEEEIYFRTGIVIHASYKHSKRPDGDKNGGGGSWKLLLMSKKFCLWILEHLLKSSTNLSVGVGAYNGPHYWNCWKRKSYWHCLHDRWASWYWYWTTKNLLLKTTTKTVIKKKTAWWVFQANTSNLNTVYIVTYEKNETVD